MSLGEDNQRARKPRASGDDPDFADAHDEYLT